jgi:hypothetical protein
LRTQLARASPRGRGADGRAPGVDHVRPPAPRRAAALASLSLLSPSAGAGGVSFGISAHGRHGSLGIRFGAPACAPARYPAPVCAPRYGGHWETVVERVWVAGTCQQVWVPALYATRYDACGRPYQVCVRAGYWDARQHAGHWEDRTRQVWRPATVAFGAGIRF